MQHRLPPPVYLFIELFCALLCPNKCTTMRIFKCNSFVTSSVPLISTSNAPSCGSLYRSRSAPLGVPSDEPAGASSISLTNATSSAPPSATSNASFLSPSYASSMALWTQRCTIKSNINSTMKCTFSCSIRSTIRWIICNICKCNTGATQVHAQVHFSLQPQLQP